MCHLFDETAKGETREVMKETVLDARVKGTKESKTVVEVRATELLLGEDGLMMYHLGGISLSSSFWRAI